MQEDGAKSREGKSVPKDIAQPRENLKKAWLFYLKDHTELDEGGRCKRVIKSSGQGGGVSRWRLYLKRTRGRYRQRHLLHRELDSTKKG